MTAPTDWRGVAAENTEITERVGILLRDRSRRLLRSLLRPHKRSLWLVFAVVLVQTGAAMAGPLLVSIGIDKGIPALRDGDAGPLVSVVVGIVVAAAVSATLRFWFIVATGRIGQNLLLDLRGRLFKHFQKLPPAFHEK